MALLKSVLDAPIRLSDNPTMLLEGPIRVLDCLTYQALRWPYYNAIWLALSKGSIKVLYGPIRH